MAPATDVAEAKPPLIENSSSPAQSNQIVSNKSSIQSSLIPSQEEQNELKEHARKPPYTAWTMKADVGIIGPNGGLIHNISKRGTRVEVLRVVPQYAQIMCSGCAPPKQNQAGWIDIEHVHMAWDMPEEDPLLSMLVLRKKWLKNDDTPEAITDRRSICMLFDNGYIETEKGLVWSIQGGEIILKKQGTKWVLASITAPTKAPAPSWRCDHPTHPKAQ